MFNKVIRVNKNGYEDIFIKPGSIESVLEISDNKEESRFEFIIETTNSYHTISREYNSTNKTNKKETYPKAEKALNDEREKLLSHYEII